MNILNGHNPQLGELIDLTHLLFTVLKKLVFDMDAHGRGSVLLVPMMTMC